eukprot:SAG11_NODE_14485_length_610_cov_1.272016_1_plen_76_part_10
MPLCPNLPLCALGARSGLGLAVALEGASARRRVRRLLCEIMRQRLEQAEGEAGESGGEEAGEGEGGGGGGEAGEGE